MTKPTRETCYGAGKEACREGKSWPIKPLGKPVADYDRLFNVSREEIATQTKALATPFLAKPAP